MTDPAIHLPQLGERSFSRIVSEHLVLTGQLPGIGASQAEIEARFEPIELSEEGPVVFRNRDLLGDRGDSCFVA